MFEIQSEGMDKRNDVIQLQQSKIKQLKQEVSGLEARIEHEKYLIEQNKPKAKNNEERIEAMIARLQEGKTILDLDLPEVSKFRREMSELKSELGGDRNVY